MKKWYNSIVSTKDICVSDVTKFKTVEYWENKINQVSITKQHKDNLPLVLWEPEPVHTIVTYGKVKIKRRKPAVSYETEKKCIIQINLVLKAFGCAQKIINLKNKQQNKYALFCAIVNTLK